MSANGFLALFGSDNALPHAAHSFAAGMAMEAEERRQLSVAWSVPGARCLSRGLRVTPLGEQGIVLGTIFRNGERTLVREFSPEEIAGMSAASGAAYLTSRHWGSYIAIVRSPPGTFRVLPAPMGEIGCYVLQHGDGWVVTSDVAMAQAAGLYRPALSWPAISRHLLNRGLNTPSTCLAGIREVRGGETLDIDTTGCRYAVAWSPWQFTDRSAQFGAVRDAELAIADRAHECTAARASCFENVVLTLSGGLDSSIVASLLARSDARPHALTLVTRNPDGDERHYARRVAEWLSLPLTERTRDVDGIDVNHSQAWNLPRPCARSFSQQSQFHIEALASSIGAGAVFTGGGGDNVFCFLQSASPAADLLRLHGPGPQFWRTAVDISQIAQTAVPKVVADALHRAWLGKPALKAYTDTSLLTPHAANSALDEHHPWLDLPDPVLPGTAAHVRLIAHAESFMSHARACAEIPTIAPLLSQPVVETCLRIPSWMWLEDGRNRAVARHAFEHNLPLDILSRRSKGSPYSFTAEIFDMHRQAIRELLADGLLAQAGVIDRDAVLRVIDDHRPACGEGYSRVLDFGDVEAWARSWHARSTPIDVRAEPLSLPD